MNAIIMVWTFIVMSIVAVQLDLAYCKLELELTKGVIKGRILNSRDGRPYYSYTGVPYAKPPVGRLRFKAPEPVEPWNGTLDATMEPSACIQQGSKDGHEDCLRLNVYTPVVAGNPRALPVMVWVHGGGFTWGDGGSGMYGPDYFMDKDVVLVTVNYRLGILGFLSTEDDAMAGNYGLKDQAEALRWVKENIAKFNGDPDRVTIFGGSAGAACIGLHMLSPMSKGLFHKAILQSGSPVCRWAISPAGVSRKLAHSVATVAGCNFDTSQDLVECLRKLPAQYLTDLHTKFFIWLTHPSFIFKPVVENCSSGQQAFLCHHTIYEFKQESVVPAIIGINGAEGGLYVASLYNRTSLVYDEFKANFNYLFSIMVGYNHYAKQEDVNEIGEKVLKKYFPSGILDDNTHRESVKMFTDSGFTQCIFDMAYQLSSPVYGYIYNYQNEFSHNKLYGSCEKPLGVTHGDELNGLFRHNKWNPNSLNGEDLKISKLMINIWYNFVSSDNPTIDGTENGLAWPKFTRSNQQMVLLNSSYPSIIENPFVDDYIFWSKLPISLSKHN